MNLKKDKTVKLVSIKASNKTLISPAKTTNDETIPPAPRLDVPLSVLGITLDESLNTLPLFEKINDTVIKLNNPHFIQVHCLIPQIEKPSCPDMTDYNIWITDGKCEYWSAIPTNSGGNSKISWSSEWPDGSVDWRSGGSFNITLPTAGVYWMQSRGPDLSIQNCVVDTRWISPVMPTGLIAEDIGSQKVKISWNDTSNNEVAFHILVEQYIGDKWIKLPSYIRANANTKTIDYQAQAGYYRFSIRSAMSIAEEEWSFNRIISTNLTDPLQNIKFKTPSIIKYSNVSDYVYLLVSGVFPNPVAPSNLGGTSKTDKTIYFVWQDNSNNETVFHLLEDKWINNAWIRQPLIRIPANRSSYTLPSRQPGRYRYSIRSAYSFPNTNIVRNSVISNWIEFTIP